MDYTYLDKEGHFHVRRIEGPPGESCLLHPTQLKLIVEFKNPYVLSMTSGFEEAEDPDTVLHMMVRDERPAFSGGWRRLTQQEKAAVILGGFRKNRSSQEILEWCLSNHPAIRGGFLYACAEHVYPPMLNVLIDLYDILRFKDQASMLSWLRLSHFPDFNPGDANAHCVNLIAIWGFGGICKILFGRDAETFFSRYAVKLAREHESEDVQGEVRKIAWKTTRKLASFLRHTWLLGLGEDREFSPDRFFGSKDEGGKFRDYIENLNKCLDNLSGGSKISLPPKGGHERRG